MRTEDGYIVAGELVKKMTYPLEAIQKGIEVYQRSANLFEQKFEQKTGETVMSLRLTKDDENAVL